MWVRDVLVPGLTDDADDIARTAAFAAGLGNAQRSTSCRFTRWTDSSGRTSGMPYTLEQTTAPSAELIERTIAIFRNEGLNAV